MQQLPLVVKVMVKICSEQEVATLGSKMWGEAAEQQTYRVFW